MTTQQNASNTFIQAAKWLLPMPFTIAVLLTALTFLLAWVLTQPEANTTTPYPLTLLTHWQTGFWSLLTFAMQMMLMLVLGHVLALTKPANWLIQQVVKHCTTTAKAAAFVTLATLLVGLLNWGLGLIFGAILARKTAEAALKNSRPLNYPLIGAAGYVGLMVWHGGLSGSAPLKVAEANHFLSTQMGVLPMSTTVFSPMNLTITAALLTLLPAAMAWLGSRLIPTPTNTLQSRVGVVDWQRSETSEPPVGAQHLDQSPWTGWLLGAVILAAAVYQATQTTASEPLSFLNPNYINFTLLGLGLLLYGRLDHYITAVEQAIPSAAGIMIQFPLYAGIAGLMQHSGLITVFSSWIVTASNEVTYPIFTLLSAGIVNVFVPSGGGQWAVQGPLIVDAAAKIGVPYAKCVMALAYGDQLTNMIQPFWALPLLGITRLTAQEILPYTLYLMILGGLIYTCGLLIF
ncbi:MAG: TIGR00366 family protein [Vampirovibrio sp.]|nr:TIGR00366 family protein [Vampirovibrio sp.]